MKYAIITIAMLFFTNSAFSDVEIKYHVNDIKDGKEYTNTMFLTKTMFAMKSHDDKEHVIFNGDKNVMYIIDEAKKEYIEFTEADIKKLADKINQMNKMMEEQLSQVPESQREQIKNMMKSKMPSNETVEINYEYKVTAEKDNINGYSVTKYNSYQNGEKDLQELWITDFSNIDLKEDDFDSFILFRDFLNEIFSSIGNMADIDYNLFWDFKSLNGFPVKTVTLDESGNEAETGTLESINRNFSDKSVFKVPSGYKKQDLNMD